jgi:hypothetical protein
MRQNRTEEIIRTEIHALPTNDKSKLDTIFANIIAKIKEKHLS